MAGESVRKQAAANRAAVEMAELKAALLEALRDPEFRQAFWHELAIDAQRARRERANPGRTGRPIESARDLKAVRRLGG